MIINLPKKTYLSDNRITNISKSFTHKMAAKPAGIDMERNYATVTLCIEKNYAPPYLDSRPSKFL